MLPWLCLIFWRFTVARDFGWSCFSGYWRELKKWRILWEFLKISWKSQSFWKLWKISKLWKSQILDSSRKVPKNLKISGRSQNVMKISKFPENRKNFGKFWKSSQNFQKIEKILESSEKFSKFWKFLENLKNLNIILRISKMWIFAWKSQKLANFIKNIKRLILFCWESFDKFNF